MSLGDLSVKKNAFTSNYNSSLQDCSNDIVSALPEIQSGYDYGNELLGDKQLTEEEKNKIEQDMDSLGQEFQILQKDINDEQDRSEMVLKMSVSINE